MRRAWLVWGRRHTVDVLAGVGLWLILGAAGWSRAVRMGTSPARTVVTWDEWAAALLLLPLLGVLGGAGVNAVRHEGHARANTGRLNRAMVAGGVVLALDLVLRVVLGLGWEPYL